MIALDQGGRGAGQAVGLPVEGAAARLAESAWLLPGAPDNLWHAIIFHTSGWVTRGIAADRGLPEHVPYMVVEGLVDFRGWSGFWPALEAHWAPFLEGDGTREGALAALARELGG